MSKSIRLIAEGLPWSIPWWPCAMSSASNIDQTQNKQRGQMPSLEHASGSAWITGKPEVS